MPHPDPQQVLQQLASALPLAESSPNCPAEVTQALRASKQLLEASAPGQPARQYAGSIRWTFEDDGYEPNGREIEVLIHYDWDDYSAGDSITPSSGGCAQIADLEVIAVRYFDDRGEVIDHDRHCLEAAWNAVEQNREQLEESCTDAGPNDGAGRTDPIRFSGMLAMQTSGQDQQGSPWRMTPSSRQRASKVRDLKHG